MTIGGIRGYNLHIMSYFIIFFVTLIFSFSLALLTKRTFGRVAAVGNLALIFVVYTCGLFKRLDIGVYIYIGITACLAAWATATQIKTKSNAWKGILKQPLFVFYTVVGIALGIMFLNKISTDYDELSHWALVTKNMIAYDNFGNLGDTTTMFNKYVPATGVFMYAFQIFNKSVINGHFYSAFDLLALSMLLILPDRYGKKLSIPFFGTLILVIGIPVLIKKNIYYNLLVDGILAVMTAYMYLTYLSDRTKANVFTVLDISLCAFVTVITKSSGLPLVCFAYAFILVDVLTRGRKYIKPFFKNKLNAIFIVFVVLAIVYAKVSWNIYCERNVTRAGWDSSEMTPSAILEFFKNPDEFQIQVRDKFLRTFFIGRFFYEYSVYLQQPNVFVIAVFAVCGAVVCVKNKKASFGASMFALTALLVLGYGVVMLFMYLFSFSYGESLRLASYPRYFGTVVSAFALIWTGITSDAFFPIEEYETANKRAANPIFKASVGTVFGIAITLLTLLVNGAATVKTEKFTEPYKEWIAAVSELDDTDRVYYAMRSFEYKGNNVREYLRVRYYATPTRCSGFNEGGSYAEGRNAPAPYTGNPFEMNKTSVEKLNEILLSYDYFFVDNADEAFCKKYASLFGGEIKSKTLYTVNKNGNEVVLTEKLG